MAGFRRSHGSVRLRPLSRKTIKPVSLIGFLESSLPGISYRYRHPYSPPLGQYEYSDSKRIFVSFLTNRKPFSADLDQVSAADFYIGVRCGLLHEARTKNGWTVWAKSYQSRTTSWKDKIVYRDDFQHALLAFITWYEEALRSDPALQAAFIRKFDSFCE
jgi:hypothetical protein